MKRMISSVCLVTVLGLPLLASGITDSGQGIYVDKHGQALSGADVVAYRELPSEADAVYGREEFSYEWKGAIWLFSTERNKDLFAEDPDKFAPEYGGYCAYAMANNKLSSTIPDAWTLYNDKLYLNATMNGRKKWRQDRDAYIIDGDLYWPGQLEKLLAKANRR
jgi:YHS domain-containing protein